MLIINDQLTPQQKIDLVQLQQKSLQHDHALPFFYPELLNKPRGFDSYYLYYNKQTLIGFLSFYLFYPHACEVALLVSPDERHQGIARGLLKKALPVMAKMGCYHLIFSKPAQAQDKGCHPLFTQTGSEYTMVLENQMPLPAISNPVLTILPATDTDIPALCWINDACFDEKNDMFYRFYHLLRDPQYQILVALYDQQIVGKSHFFFDKAAMILSDFAIHPDYQKQGFGKELLIGALNRMRQASSLPFSLNVASKNQSAFRLYQSNGFHITQTVHYWLILRVDLEEHLL